MAGRPVIPGEITIDDVFVVNCAECGRVVDVRDMTVLHETIGWAKKRKKGGGLHALSFPYETGRVMCYRCASSRKQTGIAQQGKLV